jgi:hypothetical protein
LYSSQNIIRVTKSRRKRMVGDVSRMVERRQEYKISVRETEGKRATGIPRRDGDGRMIFKWILKE